MYFCWKSQLEEVILILLIYLTQFSVVLSLYLLYLIKNLCLVSLSSELPQGVSIDFFLFVLFMGHTFVYISMYDIMIYKSCHIFVCLKLEI